MAGDFGRHYASHLSISEFRQGQWVAPRVQSMQDLALSPAAHVLHYSSSCFEGLKAYRWGDGSIHLFRYRKNIARMQGSAAHLCLPQPPESLLQTLITELVEQVREQVPQPPGTLYLRPTLIGTDPNIGGAASACSEALLYVLASPVGDYFAGGLRPLKLLIESQDARTTAQFGQVKTGGNYAAALASLIRARKQFQADQVLFCPADDVQETGAANFLLIDGKTLLTKRLDGSILPGVTRDSILHIARESGYTVEERDFDVTELLQRLPTSEAMLSGTAAVLAPVGTLIHQGREHRIGDGGIGKKTLALRKTLIAIQSGQQADTWEWMTQVCA